MNTATLSTDTLEITDNERFSISIMFYETAHVHSLFEAASLIVAVLDAEGERGAMFDTATLIMNTANTELTARANR